MSLLSDLYIASPADAVSYDADRNIPGCGRVEFSGLTYEELADLWAILENSDRKPEHATAFEMVHIVDGGQRLISRFPTNLVVLLATVDGAAALNAATRWVRTGELAYSGCQPSDVLPVVEAASRLARDAQRDGKSLYLWICV
jgi:hypothetical protein